MVRTLLTLLLLLPPLLKLDNSLLYQEDDEEATANGQLSERVIPIRFCFYSFKDLLNLREKVKEAGSKEGTAGEAGGEGYGHPPPGVANKTRQTFGQNPPY